ncbi:hypothetical protein HBI13_202790 [Parastagonospora nodorum]|nr:hypothetical protein HBI10_208650 [Parastagonospora nodorum]KAH4010792.1 hypothetical protein HBI13_202790 [Parastagonospora nodorum]KAH4216621.1 hypothetical protein HBI06_226810 [Parastagonospora nodorum]KAH4225526.1 hypothetical protein HBI05_225440 [Parastagonospora nodorum]KAH5655874.1 hypothetical protein HBI51_048020 [Parastagonospora nodorum]
MSYYGIHDAKVDFMICITCQSEIFAWMAEIFACPTCDGTEYAFPEGPSCPEVQEYSSRASGRGAEMQDSFPPQLPNPSSASKPKCSGSARVLCTSQRPPGPVAIAEFTKTLL